MFIIMNNEHNDIENPPPVEKKNGETEPLIKNDEEEHIEIDEIDDLYTKELDNKLLELRYHFKDKVPQNPSSIVLHESDSPLTISYHNSDDEDEHFKELTYEQVQRSLEQYYDNQTKYSNELDILITYMKGQKNLYIQSYLLCKRKLHMLMIPAMLLSTLITFLTPFFSSCTHNWSAIFLASLNGITAGLIALINYLKLETSTQTYYNSARQFDKLETSLEFVASKLMIIENEEQKSNIVYEQVKEVESKINEMKEWNSLFLPDEIRGLFPIICHINIFSFIKRIETNKKNMLDRFKDVKNEIRYILYQHNERETTEQSNRIHKRLQYLIDSKEKLKQELIHYKNAYSYIDELFTIEIKNARNKSSWCFHKTNTSFDENTNPIVDKYIQGLIR